MPTLSFPGFDPQQTPGLSRAEAAARLTRHGPNELPSAKPRATLIIALAVVREPMFVLLVACGLLYLALGDPGEAAMLLGFVVVVVAITLIQERKTERALAALRDLASPRALVIRDGEALRIPGREVVPGDWVVLAEGDRIPADGVMRWGLNLSVDESLLTGESVPVRKQATRDDPPPQAPGGDDLPFVYSGGLVVQGLGIAEVAATGLETAMGKIGVQLQTLSEEPTPLQKEIGRVVRLLASAGALLCLALTLGYGWVRGDLLQGLLAGLTLAMAILPEEFPVVLTVFLALGAWRISKSRVLTRRMPAVETLGAATVLCVDKTGTLTENRMRLAALEVEGERCDPTGDGLPERFHPLVEFAVLASLRDPFDPMERAIRSQGEEWLAASEHLHHSWEMVQEYPLTPELLALSRVWRAQGGALTVAAKGAPEAVADLCHLSAEARSALDARVETLAREGLRVLGVARAAIAGCDLPEHQHAFDFEFLGLIALADPLRDSVPAAVAACLEAGVRVVMITGDYPATAKAIAQGAGLPHEAKILTGPEIETLDAAQLQARMSTVGIVARAVPEHKLRIVRALQGAGEVVAMTGDGVNDAPALKAAHIGVAMGGRGSDVARESAGLVLLDDDFASIVRAVALGRRIHANLRKAMAFILAVHVPIVGLSLLPVALGWPLLLAPVHILFLELIIDPACSIAFEAEPGSRALMRRPPRDPNAPLFDRRMVLIALLQGLGVLAVALGLFAWGWLQGRPEDEARTLAFTALVAGNLGLILTNRSWSGSFWTALRRPNPALWWVVGGTLTALGVVLFIPPVTALFHLAPLTLPELMLSVAAGGGSLLWFELYKPLRRTHFV
ncbi:MAG: ATPase [Alphaproteobacteria bacterium CG_4_10_14_0_2_um_filter_63_37]|nr:MAG: ATPase [Proteobacteria bacterium CG1_02_64_396]PJA24667.1 MAG: ATPase [Alphaproteobacteria bacterium CG_4_10_14_0_2_um_filter_63_37]